MSEPSLDRWHARDFPILRRVAELSEIEHSNEIRPEQFADDLGIDQDEALRAVVAMHDADYVVGINGDSLGGPYRILTGLTERGRRAVGVWPSGEKVDALVEALQQAAEATSHPEEKSALRRAAGAVLGVSKDVMTEVVAAVIARSIPA
jgi:hypothetical protein